MIIYDTDQHRQCQCFYFRRVYLCYSNRWTVLPLARAGHPPHVGEGPVTLKKPSPQSRVGKSHASWIRPDFHDVLSATQATSLKLFTRSRTVIWCMSRLWFSHQVTKLPIMDRVFIQASKVVRLAQQLSPITDYVFEISPFIFKQDVY